MSDEAIRLFAGRSGWRNGNAGDEFGARLIEALTGRAVRVMAEPENAELFGPGSIAHQLPSESRAAVWGSGMIREDWVRAAPQASITALRGPMTAARLSGPRVWPSGDAEPVYGDPGLLVADVWPKRPQRFRVGIVPHYVDGDDGGICNLARKYQGPDELAVIDICGRVEDVLGQVSECGAILSSSLHGLVFADAYGIPSAWCMQSERVVGGSFKFRDYYLATRSQADIIPCVLNGCESLEDLEALVVKAPDIERLKARLLVALGVALEEVDGEREAMTS